jgi:hypothetical protein
MPKFGLHPVTPNIEHRTLKFDWRAPEARARRTRRFALPITNSMFDVLGTII